MAVYSFSCSAFSDKGSRPGNEDNLFFLDAWRSAQEGPKPFDAVKRREGAALLAVFDGMGGEAEGEFASRTAAETLAAFAPKLQTAPAGELERIAEDFFSAANAAVFSHGQEYGAKCGSTAALLLCRQDGIYAWNIGDSRIFLLRNGELQQISADDTEYARMQRIGGMDMNDPKMERLRHRLTQHLGMSPEEVRLSPHAAVLPVRKGDRFLLCSDGITDGLPGEAIRIRLDAASPAVLAKELVSAALAGGSRDNVTAVVVQVEAAERSLFRFLRKRDHSEEDGSWPENTASRS